MERGEYRKLAERESFFWWNAGRREILREALARAVSRRPLEILDLGCGPGGNILFLADFGSVVGVDASEEALALARARGGFRNLVRSDAARLPFRDGSFDVVAALDVIEHLDDDASALAEVCRVLRPRGTLLLTVPAYPWMWSKHDELLHHKRRYRKRELLAKVLAAGFAVERITHFVMPAVPFRLARKALRLGREGTDDVILPRPLNALLRGWLSLERTALRFMSLPFGSSLLLVARKPSLPRGGSPPIVAA